MRKTLIIVLSSLIISPTFAREPVGLVLSGGGAKGAAHIGVLEVLEENRIPVDIVTGTSMGAYVAGMYAMGLSADEVKTRTFGVDWSDGYDEKTSRQNVSLRRKEQSDQYQLRTGIGINLDGEYNARPSAFQGHAMAILLRQLTNNIPQLQSFDELAIPYRAVAADIETVEPYVLSKGNLSLAMQASMTVPGALKPVEWEGRMLVDGGIVNNMPVDQALALGAEHIIAVDLRDSLYGQDELNSGFNIAGQLITHMTNLGSDAQVSLLSDSDIYLQPDVSHMTAVDFDDMLSAYNAGRAIAEKKLPQLLKWQVSVEEYDEYEKQKLDRRSQLFSNSAFYIDRIEIVNHTKRSDHALYTLLQLPTGEILTTEMIEKGIERLYAQSTFDRITYVINHEGGENILSVDVNEKVWGPGYLNFKLAIEDDFASRSEFLFGAQYLYTNLTDKGGEWLTELDLGSWKRLSTEVYLPWDYEQQYYTAAGIVGNNEFRQFGRLPSDQLPDGVPESDLVYDTEYNELTTFAEIGWNINPSVKTSVGVDAAIGKYNVVNVELTQDVTYWGVYWSFLADTLDNKFFPQVGQYASVKLGTSHIRSEISGENRKDNPFYYEAEYVKPFDFGRHSWVGGLLVGGSDSEELLPVHAQDLGGLFNLSGFSRYELNGRYRALASIKYKYRLFEIDYGFVQSALFVGGSLEQGNTWYESSDIHWDNTLTAGSIFVGADSLLGPLYLGYGQAQGGHSSLYFYLGSHF